MDQNLSIRKNVANYTTKDILNEILEDVQLLASIGYPEITNNSYTVKINSKRAKSLGRCSTRDKKHYTITINSYHLKLSPASEVHNTIMHEVIHSLPGCMNHGPKWKAAASKVNHYYDFPTITRCAEVGQKEEFSDYVNATYKYIVECQSCHSKFRFMRKSKTVAACQTGRARCSCGSKNFIISENFQEVKNDYSL